MANPASHRITHVVCQLLQLPSTEAGKGDSGQDTLLVRVRTDSGLEGVGEVEGSSSVAMAVIDAPTVWYKASGLRALLIGQDPLDTEVLWKKMYDASGFYGRHAVVIQAMAGIDMALHDLKGKILKLPLYKLLGGRQHESLQAYASILFQADGEATAALAQSLVGRGYDAVKFGWGPFGASEAKDVELVAGARKGLGPDRTLLVDAACAYPDARTALSRAKALEPYNLGWLEEPLSPDDIKGYAWLRDRSPVAIAAGENESGRQEFERWVEAGALDYYQIDLGKCGVRGKALIVCTPSVCLP